MFGWVRRGGDGNVAPSATVGGGTRPGVTPTGAGLASPTATMAVATRVVVSPTLPAGQKPPRPVPDPAAVAAGAPLRATLLAQIDRFEAGLGQCAARTPVPVCSGAVLRELGQQSPEFAAYVSWRDAIWYCVSDGRGGYTRINTFVYYPPTPNELRDPATLDVYVSGTPWCNETRPK
ncbi:MAG: hypothetical protein U0841_14220 [Chloroflexia bacterium]